MEKIKGSVTNPIQDKEAAQKPSFNPNFKFKAANKEYEVPEFLRGVIKDEQSQKYMHELLEKAYGLPTLKERFNETRTQLQQANQVVQTHQQVMSTINEAQQAYRQGDLDTVFEIFKINPEKVLKWAVKQVEYSQMPPEQRQLMEAQRLEQRRNMELMKQQQSLSQSQIEQQSQYIGEMLNLILERPDYSAVAQSYDARRGQPGAFRDLIAQIGESEYALSGTVLSPMEAAKRAAELIGEAPGRTQAAQEATPAPVQPATQATPKKAVLPNLANAGARAGAAPAKSKYRSIDDLKKRHQELMGGN